MVDHDSQDFLSVPHAMPPPRPLAAAFCAHAARSGSRAAAADACRHGARRPPACAVTQRATSCACRRAVLTAPRAPGVRRTWAGQGGQGVLKRRGSARGVFDHLPHHHDRVGQHEAPRSGQIPDHLLVEAKRLIELSKAGERDAQRHDRAGRVVRKVAFATTPPSHISSPNDRQGRGWGGALAPRLG